MKNILRWIAVLPCSILAMCVVNIINGFTVAEIAPHFVEECCKSWFGSLAFVMAAYYIAPSHKSTTAVVVASAYCAIGIFAVCVSLRSGDSNYSPWLLIVATVVSVTASVIGCLMCFSYQKQHDTELLENSQRN